MHIHEVALRRVPLFKALPESELRELARGLLPMEMEQGSLMFREGDRGDEWYIVVEGLVEIIKSLGTPDERLLGVRKPGGVIGEMSLFSEDHKRTASVRAKTPLKLLVMKRDDLERLLRKQPDLTFNLVATLSRRLEESENHAIRDLREKNRQLQQAFDELKVAQIQIVEKERLERELEVARDIQLSILPRALPDNTSWEFGIHFSSMEAVGGDFYDVIELGNGKLGVAVGDVSGHGVPAALFMSLTATLLRAEAVRSDSPAEVLQAVNRQLLATSDSGLFITVIYGILDSSSRSFQYARAGHPTPLLIHPGRPAVQLEAELGQVLGFHEELALDEVAMSLPQDSAMLIYTDGITEAMGSDGDSFGEARVMEAMGAGEIKGAEEICQQVWKALQAFRGTVPQDDDVTLLAVRSN